MAREIQPYKYITASESVANAVSRNNEVKVYTSSVSYDGGGRLTTTRKRFYEAIKSKNKWEIFEKEQEMGRVLARDGHRVMHREGEGERNTYDAIVDGKKADFKRVASHNNIVNYAKKAVREQGAEIVVFQIDKENSKVYEQLNVASRQYNIHGYYFFTNRKQSVHIF